MVQTLPARWTGENWGMKLSSSVVWGFLAIEVALLVIAAVAGIQYALLILVGTSALCLCFIGRLPAVLFLIAISPVVYLENIPSLVIRTGKWGFVILLVLTWFLGKAIRGEGVILPKTSVNSFVVCFGIWSALISVRAVYPLNSFAELLRLLSIFGLFSTSYTSL